MALSPRTTKKTKKAKSSKAGSSTTSQVKASSRKKSGSLLSQRSPLAGRLALVLAAVCVVAGYILISHSLAATSSDATLAIVSGYNGKCLDDFQNKSANNAVVDIYACNNSTAQLWSGTTNRQLTIHGKCLDVSGGVASNGRIVGLYTCKKAGDKTLTNQQWTTTSAHGVSVKLIAADKKTVVTKCLQAPANKNGLQLQIWDCNGSQQQKWTTPLVIASGYKNECLDDYQSKTNDGAVVDIWTCNGTAAQQWSISDNGQIKIAGKCLDVVNNGVYNGTLGNGQIVDLYTCKSASDAASTNQKWSKANNNGLSVKLTYGDKTVTKCLQAPANKNGLQLQIWDCNGSAQQKWVSQPY